MKELMVIAYDNPQGAKEALKLLRRLSNDWIAYIDDAVAVERDAEGNLQIQQSYQPTTKQGAQFGVFLGTLLGGLALAPLTGGVSAVEAAGRVAAGALGGAALGGVMGASQAHTYKEDIGLPEDFVSKVSRKVKPGGSAIFALVDNPYSDPFPQDAEFYFRGTGGTVISTNLTPQQQERVQQVLKGKA